jgi:predicted HTH domain antitoxin
MNVETLGTKIPRDFEHALRLTKDELEDHLLLMAALKMFELGKISLGKAAELAQMSRVEFMEMCSKYRISLFNYSEDELENELRCDIEAADSK